MNRFLEIKKMKELIKQIEDKIKYYQKASNENDEQYCKIDDFGLNFAGEKLNSFQKQKAMKEIMDSTIFLQGKIEAFQEILNVLKGKIHTK